MNTDNMQHGYTWSGQDVAGWIATEKYDGIRAYWDGETMWTRGGKAVPVPQEWREALPAGVHLDGEIFAGYGSRKRAEWMARAGKYAEECRLLVFDVPTISGNYFDRMRYARDMLPNNLFNRVARMVVINKITGINEAVDMMKTIHTQGGEGLILRHPDLAYAPGRTDQLLKLKTWEIGQ
jgi:DNA ligase-1